MPEFTARRIRPFISMRAEIIALCLQQIGREALGAITVEVAQGCKKRRRRNSRFRGFCTNEPPPFLRGGQPAREKGIEHKIFQIWILLVRIFDFTQEAAADDAAASPKQSNGAQIQIPAVNLGGFCHKRAACA